MLLVGASSLFGLTANVCVKLDLRAREKIYSPGTFVSVVQEGQSNRRESISSLCLEPVGSIVFDWPRYLCKKTEDIAKSAKPIQIKSEEKQRPIQDVNMPAGPNEYDAYEEIDENAGDSVCFRSVRS